MSTEVLKSLAEFDCPWTRVDVTDDPWQRRSREERDAIRLGRLGTLLEYARELAPYYRELLPARSLASLDELAQLPVLKGGDYRAHTPPNGHGLLADVNASGFALASGGTTGAPRSCYRTVEEQHIIAVHLARGLAAAGIRRGDVVANMMPPGNLWVPFISFTMALEHLDCRILPIGHAYSAEAAIRWMEGYGVAVLLGYPAELVRVALEAPAGLQAPAMRLITTSGSPVYASTRRVLERTFGSPAFMSSGYASNDTGPMGFQCEHCPTGVFHLQEELQILEIVDWETGRPVPRGTMGRMLFTSLLSRVLPVVRYEIGDIGRMLDEDGCPCGRVQPRFELSGRSNDVLIGEAVQILPEMISEAVAQVDGLSPEWQMRIVTDGDGEAIVLQCETVPGVEPSTLDRDHIRAQVIRFGKDLGYELGEGRLKRLDIDVLAYGLLPRSPRTGKVTLFVDERVR